MYEFISSISEMEYLDCYKTYLFKVSGIMKIKKMNDGNLTVSFFKYLFDFPKYNSGKNNERIFSMSSFCKPEEKPKTFVEVGSDYNYTDKYNDIDNVLPEFKLPDTSYHSAHNSMSWYRGDDMINKMLVYKVDINILPTKDIFDAVEDGCLYKCDIIFEIENITIVHNKYTMTYPYSPIYDIAKMKIEKYHDQNITFDINKIFVDKINTLANGIVLHGDTVLARRSKNGIIVPNLSMFFDFEKRKFISALLNINYNESIHYNTAINTITPDFIGDNIMTTLNEINIFGKYFEDIGIVKRYNHRFEYPLPDEDKLIISELINTPGEIDDLVQFVLLMSVVATHANSEDSTHIRQFLNRKWVYGYFKIVFPEKNYSDFLISVYTILMSISNTYYNFVDMFMFLFVYLEQDRYYREVVDASKLIPLYEHMSHIVNVLFRSKLYIKTTRMKSSQIYGGIYGYLDSIEDHTEVGLKLFTMFTANACRKIASSGLRPTKFIGTNLEELFLFKNENIDDIKTIVDSTVNIVRLTSGESNSIYSLKHMIAHDISMYVYDNIDISMLVEVFISYITSGTKFIRHSDVVLCTLELVDRLQFQGFGDTDTHLTMTSNSYNINGIKETNFFDIDIVRDFFKVHSYESYLFKYMRRNKSNIRFNSSFTEFDMIELMLSMNTNDNADKSLSKLAIIQYIYGDGCDAHINGDGVLVVGFEVADITTIFSDFSMSIDFISEHIVKKYPLFVSRLLDVLGDIRTNGFVGNEMMISLSTI